MPASRHLLESPACSLACSLLLCSPSTTFASLCRFRRPGWIIARLCTQLRAHGRKSRSRRDVLARLHCHRDAR
ncbi:hypothetical protein HDK77DRAFT_449101 [Phyllosticta capitalensis]|uniref:Secreted protein n=1 Tax=Phyllosticta capitalensis TaxID=121624 RepID=A0ABR1YEB6_9PEZI